MLTLKRTRDFVGTVMRLRKALADSPRSDTQKLQPPVAEVGVVTRRSAQQRRQRLSRSVERERALMRRVPMQLSLIERSLPPPEKRLPLALPDPSAAPADPFSTASSSASPNPNVPTFFSVDFLTSFLLSLQYAEKQRSLFYAERVLELEGAVRRTAGGPSSAKHKTGATDDGAAEAHAAAVQDLEALRGSLVSSPYLSARMWRSVLQSGVWQLAAAEHRQTGSSALVVLSGAFCRVVLGALRDYTAGSDLHASSPRFVVSLPSRAYRQRTQAAEDVQETAVALPREDSGTAPADALADMMMMTTAAAPVLTRGDEGAPASVTIREAAKRHPSTRRRARAIVRWIPPHASGSVLALTIDTLALQSFVIGELRVDALASDAVTLLSLFRLLGTVQKIATAAVVLLPPPPEAPQAHAVLHRTEDALVAAASGAKAALAASLRSVGAGGARTVLDALEPAAAAQLLMCLDNLQQLHPGDRGTRDVVAAAAVVLFPELRSNTRRVLASKARAGALSAFMTRGHRQRLRAELREGGAGGGGFERYLQGTVVQRARLERRRTEMALRERYMADAHHRSVVALLTRLGPGEAVQLFQILAAHVASDSGRSAAAASDACLFVGEGMLLTGMLDTPVAAGGLQLPSLTGFYTGLAMLCGPLSEASAMARGSAAESPLVILGFLLDGVLARTNEALAARLESVRVARAHEHEAMKHERRGRVAESVAAAAVEPVHVREYTELLRALTELLELDGAGGARTMRRWHDVAAGARTQRRLLKDLLFHDRALWREVRGLRPEQQQVFRRDALRCFCAVSGSSLSGTNANSVAAEAVTTELLDELCDGTTASFDSSHSLRSVR